MSQQGRLTSLLVVSAVFAVTSTSAGVGWDDIGIYTDPSLPTDEDIFDLDAVRLFPDSGYLSIDQSISVRGHEIDIWALIQDQHTRHGTAFLTVLTPGGAFFDDFGPLAAGTYQVNVEMWLTPWPATSGGYLYDEETLELLVRRAGSHETPAGDFNGDHEVNAGDYVAWRNNDGASEGYKAWRANFGTSASNGSIATGSVPEPATLLLLLLALASGVVGRRTFKRTKSSPAATLTWYSLRVSCCASRTGR